MNIYILELVRPYDGSDILAGFDSKKKAIKSAQSRQKKQLVWESIENVEQAKTIEGSYFVITEIRIQ